MRILLCFLAIFMLITTSGTGQEPVTAPQDINIGKVYFPRPFLHEGKDFKKGVYMVSLTEKDGEPYFKVSDKNKKLLFEELAVVKSYKKGRKNFKYRVRKGMLKGYEYFRIKVIKPGKLIMAYFLIKKSPEAPKKK